MGQEVIRTLPIAQRETMYQALRKSVQDGSVTDSQVQAYLQTFWVQPEPFVGDWQALERPEAAHALLDAERALDIAYLDALCASQIAAAMQCEVFAAQTRECPDRNARGSVGPEHIRAVTGGISGGIGEPDGTSCIPHSGHRDDSDICAAKTAHDFSSGERFEFPVVGE